MAKWQQPLAKIGFKGFESANDNDWDDVRRLQINADDTRIIVEK